MYFLRRVTLFLTMAGILFLGILSADGQTHVVARGETIYSISRQFGVTADALMRANGISDPSALQVGRRLNIPSASASTNTTTTTATAAATTPAQTAQNLSDYRVVRGDTLYSIARSNNISLQTLLEINRFPANQVLRVGDVIKVPARSSSAAATANIASTAAAASTNAPSARQVPAGVYALRWPVTPKDITYMSGQMGVVVEGEALESVRSLTQGNVISAGPWRKFGRVVIVETAGGYFYMYGGCESLSVRVGDRIAPGTEVGRLGVNSVSEKPQLFFMVFRSDTPIDPAQAPRAGIPAASANNTRS
jgi:LysM repeat protein